MLAYYDFLHRCKNSPKCTRICVKLAAYMLWCRSSCRVWVGVYLLTCKNTCSWPYGSNICERRTTTFWPLIARLQRLNSKWIWNAINQVISLIGTRVYIFQSVKHFCCTLTLASWVLSQADLFLPRLTISPHPTLFFLILLSLSFSPLLSPALSVSLLGMFVQLVNRPLLEYHICCWEVLCALLLLC